MMINEEYKEIKDYINLSNVPQGIDLLSLAHRILLFDNCGIDKRGVIHLGAHLGQEIPMYIQLGFHKLLMVEPQLPQFTKLANYGEEVQKCLGKFYQLLALDENKCGTKIQCVQSAVSSKSGTAKLYTMGNTVWSSTMEPDTDIFYKLWRENCSGNLKWYQLPLAWLSLLREVRVKKISGVQTKTLDDLMSELDNGWQMSDFSYLHMNIQGSELMALQGGKQTLKHLQAIWLETNIDERYKGAPLKQEFDNFLGDFNFVCTMALKIGSIGNVLYLKEELLSR
jgi:FkbM family methyltransferase